ncbi:MAG TPA: hypothetical protein VE463_07940, partial [Blastococcus sp.]|nr:hypothetical protein [Blastococcus sp.]
TSGTSSPAALCSAATFPRSAPRGRRAAPATATDELATLLHPLAAAVVGAGGVPVGGGLGSPWPPVPGAGVP